MLTYHLRSFPNDLDRVTAHDYVVRDDDIMRAKLRTVGIQEHRIYFKQGPRKSPECECPPLFDYLIV
jgi:hypothetical protein